VHIVPDAISDLEGVIEYPIAGVTVLGGILALVVIDSHLTALWAPEVRRAACVSTWRVFPGGGGVCEGGILALVAIDSHLTALWAPEVRRAACVSTCVCVCVCV
jgi:hypothetical protein